MIALCLSLLATLPQAPPEQVLGQRLARLRERIENRELLAVEQMRQSDGSLHLASMVRIRTSQGCESLDWWTAERLGTAVDQPLEGIAEEAARTLIAATSAAPSSTVAFDGLRQTSWWLRVRRDPGKGGKENSWYGIRFEVPRYRERLPQLMRLMGRDGQGRQFADRLRGGTVRMGWDGVDGFSLAEDSGNGTIRVDSLVIDKDGRCSLCEVSKPFKPTTGDLRKEALEQPALRIQAVRWNRETDWPEIVSGRAFMPESMKPLAIDFRVLQVGEVAAGMVDRLRLGTKPPLDHGIPFREPLDRLTLGLERQVQQAAVAARAPWKLGRTHLGGLLLVLGGVVLWFRRPRAMA